MLVGLLFGAQQLHRVDGARHAGVGGDLQDRLLDLLPRDVDRPQGPDVGDDLRVA
jgi:hypothetical protein